MKANVLMCIFQILGGKMKTLLIITILSLTACASGKTETAKAPCKPESTQTKVIDTAMAAYMLSLGKGFYYPSGGC